MMRGAISDEIRAVAVIKPAMPDKRLTKKLIRRPADSPPRLAVNG